MWRFEEVPFEQMIWKLSPRRGYTGYSYKLMSKMSPYTSNYVVILPYWHQLILLFFLSFWRWRECFIDFLYVLTIFDILLNFFFVFLYRQEAAGALWNLSFDDRNREAIAATGGVEALVWTAILENLCNIYMNCNSGSISALVMCCFTIKSGGLLINLGSTIELFH